VETCPTTRYHLDAQTEKGDAVNKASGRVKPDTYLALVKRHPLRSIRTEADLDAAQAVIDELVAEDLDAGGQSYLDALSDLVILYEQERHPVTPLPPAELLAHLLAERGWSQAELGRRADLSRAAVSELVSGKRPFTVAQMHAVATAFGVPPAVFLAPR
jgi:HTH-type transcriptional regulator / antitoxin HigA